MMWIVGKCGRVIFIPIYSYEGKEPQPIHVDTPEGECKFWLQPVQLARNRGLLL